MTTHTFNSSVIASAYTGYILIPEGEKDFYEAVGPLIKLLKDRAGLEGVEFLDPECQRGICSEMETMFPNLQKFKQKVDAYFENSPEGLFRKEHWPNVKKLADEIIGEKTIEI